VTSAGAMVSAGAAAATPASTRRATDGKIMFARIRSLRGREW
jgi:hypothetical protein